LNQFGFPLGVEEQDVKVLRLVEQRRVHTGDYFEKSLVSGSRETQCHVMPRLIPQLDVDEICAPNPRKPFKLGRKSPLEIAFRHSILFAHEPKDRFKPLFNGVP
jgi:hypothetical protein